MADNGIRTTNLPLGPLIEVIGHADNGNGQPGEVRRQKLEDLVQYLLGLAGLDPSGVADLSTRIYAEVARAEAAEVALDGRITTGGAAAASALDTLDTLLRGLISDETTRATAAEGGIDTRLRTILPGDGSVTLPGANILSWSRTGFVITDPAGFVLLRLGSDGMSQGGSITSASGRAGSHLADQNGFVARSNGNRFSQREIAEENARALAHSAIARSRVSDEATGLAFDINQVLGTGQSLMAAQTSWPAITLTVVFSDLQMLGQSVRGTDAQSTGWTPLGDSVLRPLVATVQAGNGGAVLTPTQQAALDHDNAALGETPLEGGLVYFRKLVALGQPRTPCRIVATNVATPGQSIEDLTTTHYPRVTDGITAVKNAAAAAGSLTHGVVAIWDAQGENNYASNGGSPDKATFKAAKKAYYDKVTASVMSITGQAYPPSIITYQTGEEFTVDATGLSVGMAEWELSKENPRYVMATPVYPFIDKFGHLDPNGSRWMGLYYGRAMYHEQVLRRRWRPLEPIRVRSRGRQILVSFSVPRPPLQWRLVFTAQDLVDYATKGFAVTNDATGAKLVIRNVEIASDTGVLITLAEEVPAFASLWAGRLDDSFGSTNLCDSDDGLAPFPYTYTAGSGQWTTANQPTLNGNPYPLNNWCVCFKLPIQAG